MGTNTTQPVGNGSIPGAVDELERRSQEAQLASARMATIQTETAAITGINKASGDLAAQIGGDLRQSAKMKE